MRLHSLARTCPHCRFLIVSKVIDDRQQQATVARDFRISEATVKKWVRRYRREGRDGLNDKTSRPKTIPRKLLQPGPELNDALMKLLHTPPSEHGYNRTTWRLKDIKNILDQQGKVASLSNISAAIKSAGLRWKKARITLTSSDPEYRPKLDAIKSVLGQLTPEEAFFSIDELGPVAVKMRGGRSLQFPGEIRTVPQWQKSRGAFILTAALDLARNQISYFFSERKNTEETVRLVELLRERYANYRTLYLSWDSAPWHRSARFKERLQMLNDQSAGDQRPRIEILPLPTSAQFLNVIESVFSGMARAILHNSDYASVEDAQAAVTRYLEERNEAFLKNPKVAGRTIWRQERTPGSFHEANNCKDPRWMER